MNPKFLWALAALFGSRQLASGFILPEGSWDSHIHVIDPAKYPLPKNVSVAHTATLAQAYSNAERLHLPNMVFMQLSTYGNDNTWILDTLKQVGPRRGRGVVVFDPSTIQKETLQQWHAQGVRGVRLNLKSKNITMSKNEIQDLLRKYADKLRPMKTWSIGLYADMEVLEHVQPIVPELGVKIVLEHFGTPSSLRLDQSVLPGWRALKTMMQDSRVYAKISGPYMYSDDPEFKDLEPLAKSLLSMRNGKGVVFASDWPHTKSPGYNILPFVERVVSWCGEDERLKNDLFRDNAKVLWDAE
jgi:predicted TIM-barrel fold metal-dependent hydrolase